MSEMLGKAFGDLYHQMQQLRPGLERVVARAGVGTFIGCMAPARETVARDVAVDFYTHLLAGAPIAHALFIARASCSAAEEDTALLFAMAGYPDAYIVEDRTPSGESVPRRARKRQRRISSRSRLMKRGIKVR